LQKVPNFSVARDPGAIREWFLPQCAEAVAA